MTVTTLLGCIVEGHGEREAVPELVRRIAEDVAIGTFVRILPPFRIPKSRLMKDDELERAVTLLGRKVAPTGSILILIDADDDCPGRLGPSLVGRARAARPDLPIGVAIAKREFESWFLAAAHSLRGTRGLPGDLEPPADPEEVRGAKEWLTARMGRRYVETRDQPAFAATFDLGIARRADSFDKCYREVSRLLRAAAGGKTP
jgi:hypothetical protein